METKRNLKYFTAPPISIPAIIGWVITAIGVCMFAFIPYLKMVGVIVAIVGFATVVFTSGGASNDTDIEYQVSERIKDLQELNEKKFEVYERSFLKMMQPITLRGYEFEVKEESFYFKKGQDGANRTNYFKGCNLIFTNEKIFIYGKRFSLTDEAINETITISYYFNELDKVELTEKAYAYTKGERQMEAKYYVFNLLKNDGTSALALNLDVSADIEKYAEQITRVISVRQKELAKRAEETAARRAAFRAQMEEEKAAIARGEMEAEEPQL